MAAIVAAIVAALVTALGGTGRRERQTASRAVTPIVGLVLIRPTLLARRFVSWIQHRMMSKLSDIHNRSYQAFSSRSTARELDSTLRKFL